MVKINESCQLFVQTHIDQTSNLHEDVLKLISLFEEGNQYEERVV